MKKLLLVLSTIFIMGLVGCTSSSDISTLERIKEKGEILVGTSPDFPPYEFKIIENGEEKLVGHDIQIAKEIAKEIGVDIRFVESDFSGLIVGLTSEQTDMVISGLSPTEERKKTVNFSDIYYQSGQSILVRKSDKENLNTIDSFIGKKVGVQVGSLQETMGNEQLTSSEIIALPKVTSLIMELKDIEGVSGVIMETVVAEGYANQFDELAVSDVVLTAEIDGSAIAVRKGDDELTTQINTTIARLKEEGLIDQYVAEANQIANSLSE